MRYNLCGDENEKTSMYFSDNYFDDEFNRMW